MEEIKKIKKILRNKKDFDELNNFLSELSEYPNQEILSILHFLFENLNSGQLSKIRLNLIFLIEEISNTQILDSKYIDFLINSYYESDRWVRNEVVKALYSILKSNPNFPDIVQSVIKIVEIGLREDYEPIRQSSLNFLTLDIFIPRNYAAILISILDSKKAEINETICIVLKKIIPEVQDLFEFLNKDKAYKILDKEKIRFLLIEYGNSVSDLRLIHKLIESSIWDANIKELFFKEIHTLERILLKK